MEDGIGDTFCNIGFEDLAGNTKDFRIHFIKRHILFLEKRETWYNLFCSQNKSL